MSENPRGANINPRPFEKEGLASTPANFFGECGEGWGAGLPSGSDSPERNNVGLRLSV